MFLLPWVSLGPPRGRPSARHSLAFHPPLAWLAHRNYQIPKHSVPVGGHTRKIRRQVDKKKTRCKRRFIVVKWYSTSNPRPSNNSTSYKQQHQKQQ